MIWFGRRRKRRRNLTVPEFSDRPIVAYVERVDRDRHTGVVHRTKIGAFDFVPDLNELVSLVANEAGAGEFKARVYCAEDKRVYLGIHVFYVSGVARSDGRGGTKPRARTKSPEVQAIEEEIKYVKLLTKVEDLQRTQRKLKREDQASRARGKRRAHPKRPGPPPADACRATGRIAGWAKIPGAGQQAGSWGACPAERVGAGRKHLRGECSARLPDAANASKDRAPSRREGRVWEAGTIRTLFD